MELSEELCKSNSYIMIVDKYCGQPNYQYGIVQKFDREILWQMKYTQNFDETN